MLVYVMAAGVNYNSVWAALGRPVDVIAARRREGSGENFHVGGSEASGIVWAVGDGVHRVEVGDHVVVAGCQWDETAPDIRAGTDPISSRTQKAWGYELNHGSYAQFTAVLIAGSPSTFASPTSSATRAFPRISGHLSRNRSHHGS
ncbi:alcohol dehydrogenase catalytic domain-containing protein [Nocardia sp. NPDC049149]|uniref:alcohol dehydrogenase catalytic domain-containing protein n=1 Tax=Nocardia sp. NPDC049149 TaxID=3364315 RepID=UPI00371791FD